MHESSTQTRRQFLQDTATLAAGVSLAWPLASTAAARQVAANEKLAIGIIGAGGRGWDNLQGVKSERIVALADVDDKQAKNAFKQFPDAARYRDFREMLDKEKSLDAVVVSTPDHVHATAAIAAMNRGLHVYCEKPLAHTIYEARRMSEVAQKTGVVTQMGIQGHAMEGTRRAVEVVRSGRYRRRERAACLDRSTGRLVAAGRRATEGFAPRFLKRSIGTCGWARRRCDLTTRCTCRSSGAVAGTSAPARSATWACTISIPRIGRWSWVCRRRPTWSRHA